MKKVFKFFLIFFFLTLAPFFVQADCTNPVLPSNRASSVVIPATLDWCDGENAQSYKLQIHEIDGEGEEQYFSTRNTIISELCIKDFNENTTYRWQIAECANQDFTNCGNFSQKWEFTTDGAAAISHPSVSLPADEANASIPVTLDWSDVVNAKSYYLNIYKDDTLIDFIITTESEISLGFCPLSKNSTYEWQVAACLNENGTRCDANCCNDESGYNCADFSEARTFNTTDTGIINPPRLISPTSTDAIPLVNLTHSLQWERTCGAESYRYRIKEGEATKVNKATSGIEVGFSDFWDDLDYGTTYSWQAKSCWDETGDQCEEDWSQVWEFKTAGGTLTITGPDNNATNVVIPVNLSWEDIAASSYTYEVSADNSFSETQIVTSTNITLPEASINYPTLAQNTQYWWHVKACVDRQGNNCGDWSSVYNFTTFELGAPCVSEGSLDEGCLSPEHGGSLFTYQKNISWRAVEGAKTYKYRIDYILKDLEESDENCVAGQSLIEDTTTNNSVRVPLRCLGTYNWWLQSCLDQNCTEVSDLTPMLSFIFIQPVPPAQFGLVPCGRVSDAPDTPWNERDPCEIKHVFLLVKNIIDFVLWRIGLIALALLIIFTAVVSYFSLGAPGTVVNVKQIWQRAGIGYLIMFLAWWIINIIVKIVGFTDTWWSLPF